VAGLGCYPCSRLKPATRITPQNSIIQTLLCMQYNTNAYVSTFHANGLCKSFICISLEVCVISTGLLTQL